MPVKQKKNGKWYVEGTKAEHDTKEKAEEQQRAIYAAKERVKKGK